VRILTVVGLFFLLAAFSIAQTPTGTIQGTVLDQQSAGIGGATVTITNTATGTSRTVTSDDAGRFSAPFLSPGNYTVLVEANGFKQDKRENVIVAVSETLPVTFTLALGKISETVEVTTSVGNLDTESSSLNTVIGSREVLDMPLNGRNPFSLATLVPAVNNVGQASTPHIGGSRNANNEQLIDGMTNILPENNVGNNESAYQPIVDSVQEFSVQTSVLPADYGRFSGGTVSLITKSGGDHYHGSGFLFARNDALDAREFSFGANAAQPSLYRYQDGGTFGGPVPFLDRPDKRTFFFFAFEDQRQQAAASETDSVPQPQWINGDFSDLIPAGTNCNATPVSGCIYDPNTVAVNSSGQYVRQAFPGNIIPTADLNSVVVNSLKYFPAPNVPGAGLYNNYFVSASTTDNYWHFDTRFDHDFTKAWHSFFRFSHWNENFTSLSDYGNAASSGYNGPGTNTEWSGSFNNTITISPTLLAEIRIGASRAAYNRTTFGQPFDLASLGFPASYVSTAALDGLVFPTFQFSQGFSTLGPSGYNSFYEKPSAFSFTGSLVEIHGAHTLKFGAEYRLLYENFAQYGYPSGQFIENQDWTQQIANSANGTGNPFATALLGLMSGGSQITHQPTATDLSKYVALFFQDDWKVTRKLTLNLGLRWDVEVPRTDRYNQLSYWNPNVPSAIQLPAGSYDPTTCPACGSLMGQMFFVGTPGSQYGRAQGPTQWKDFGPRIGLAYNPIKNLVIRGGFGIVYAPSALQAAGTDGAPGIEGFSSSTSFNSSFTSQQTPPSACTNCSTFTDPAPTGFNLPRGVSGGPNTDVGSGIFDSFFGSYRNPYSEQWNLNIQYALPHSTTVEVGYLGNHGLFLINGDPGVPYGQLPPSDLALGNALYAQVANPFYGYVNVPGSPLDNPTVQANYLLSPYPQYLGSVQSFRKPQAESKYNAMTVKVEKKFTAGFSILGSFTWGKLFDNSASAVNYLGPASQTYTNQYAPQNEWALSAQNVTRMLVVSAIYELPFGNGKRFLGDAHGAVNRIVGGWQFVTLATFSDGTPLVLAAATDQSGLLGYSKRPDWTGQNPAIHNQNLNQWFNTTVFSQPAAFTLGNAPRTLDTVNTPGVNDWNISFFKNNYFGADNRYNLQFRVEMFNAFNHPQFGAPDANVNDGTFGKISSMGSFYNPRNVQLALKFYF
jgi:Carboxypeptidase regulatory-like domain/TonB dependent receptor